MSAPRKVKTSHSISIGDIVTAGNRKMRGEVISILESRLWTNGGVPIVKVAWESGAIGKHPITRLRRLIDV